MHHSMQLDLLVVGCVPAATTPPVPTPRSTAADDCVAPTAVAAAATTPGLHQQQSPLHTHCGAHQSSHKPNPQASIIITTITIHTP